METQGQQQIRCSINNCHYWVQGNSCQAAQILVTSDALSQSLADKIDALQAGQVTETPVNKALESCCKTFVQKNSFSQNMDGVYKK